MAKLKLSKFKIPPAIYGLLVALIVLVILFFVAKAIALVMGAILIIVLIGYAIKHFTTKEEKDESEKEN